MSQAPNEKVKQAHALFKQGMSLIDISKKLDLPAGTIRRWKSAYKWDGERSDKSERSEKKTDVVRELINSNLNDKQKLFCVYYVKCFNATKAYQKAYGCDEYSARVNGSKALTNANIRDEITRLKQYKFNQAFLAPDDIFQKYMDIAFADITDYITFGREEKQVMGIYGPLERKTEDGEKEPITETVNVVNWKNKGEVDGTIVSEIKIGRNGDANIKLADRMKALQWLTDHMDMATEEQKARIAVLRAKAQTGDTGNTESDGFIDALSGKVDEIWQE